MRDEAEGDFDLDKRSKNSGGIGNVTSLHQHTTRTHLPFDTGSISINIFMLHNGSTPFVQNPLTTRPLHTAIILPQSSSKALIIAAAAVVVLDNPSSCSSSVMFPSFLQLLLGLLTREKHARSRNNGPYETCAAQQQQHTPHAPTHTMESRMTRRRRRASVGGRGGELLRRGSKRGKTEGPTNRRGPTGPGGSELLFGCRFVMREF